MMNSIISNLVKKKILLILLTPFALHAQINSAEYLSTEGKSNQWVYINFYNHQLVRKTFNADFKLKQCTTRNADSYIESLQNSQSNCTLLVFISETGKVCIQVKYGSRTLEVGKGKNSVEISSGTELIKALETLKLATESGEFDAQLESAGLKHRNNFHK